MKVLQENQANLFESEKISLIEKLAEKEKNIKEKESEILELKSKNTNFEFEIEKQKETIGDQKKTVFLDDL